MAALEAALIGSAAQAPVLYRISIQARRGRLFRVSFLNHTLNIMPKKALVKPKKALTLLGAIAIIVA